jgi:transcriptional regulator with XRE-family HTH domain
MAKNPNNYTSVTELFKNVVSDDASAKALECRIASRRLIKHLLAMRAARGISQKELADKLHCTQSRISKLERSKDSDLSLGDIEEYAKAVGCDFVAAIMPQNIKPVERVKRHVFAIKKHMDDLADLANADAKIAEGVVGFFTELLLNFTRLFGDSVKRLPPAPNGMPYMDFRFSEIDPSEPEEDGASDHSIPDCVEPTVPLLATP